MNQRKRLKILLVTLIFFSGCSAHSDSHTSQSSDLSSESEETESSEVTDFSQSNTSSSFDFSSINLKEKVDVEYSFRDVSVHDPSIIKVGNEYFIFGSHLAAAKSSDLMNWSMIDSGVKAKNKIIPNATEEMKESFEWAKTTTFWAPDVIQLNDGKFYMYYCNCEGSSPLSSLGYAVADQVEGPYKDLGILLKSGMSAGTPSENGDRYNANIHPNVIDPHVFFDAQERLWMVYGSYSGGIFILELNPDTGTPLESGYGKKLLGENHLRIEGPYILYSPHTEYYYLFLSFGGLDSTGAYNIRVARSKTPDGPYLDAQGQDMIDCKGPPGSFFDDEAAEPYGVKLMGNYRWEWFSGENGKDRKGLVSPGHNSAFYDEDDDKYYLFFHTRFEDAGETHKVRVHQFYFNEKGWPVVSPYRYVGETIDTFSELDIPGIYKFIDHGKDTSSNLKTSANIELHSDFSVSGTQSGTWELKNGNFLTLTLEGEKYYGVVLKQWDEFGKKMVMVFTAQSEKGISVWGSGLKA